MNDRPPDIVYARMLRKIDTLSAQRDELVEALEMLVADVQDYPAWQRPCAAVDNARAAIAKAKEQQP